MSNEKTSDERAEIEFRDARIKELEEILKATEKTQAFQAERADKAEAGLKSANEKHSFQKKRADKVEADLARVLHTHAEDEAVNQVPTGDYASFGGTTYAIIGDFRADNTFAEVKRGYCPEGITLLAINKPH